MRSRSPRWADRLLGIRRPVVLVKKFPKGPMFLLVRDRKGRTKIEKNWIP